MKNGLFSADKMQTIQKLRKVFLKVAVWILIGELVLGAIMILIWGWNAEMGKILGTFMVLALMLFISVNNFTWMEKGTKIMQGMALAGFISNIIWAWLAILILWEVAPATVAEEIVVGRYTRYKYSMSVWSILALIGGYTAMAGLWIPTVMSIKETIKTVKPLKITAIVCLAYLWVYGTIVTIIQPEFDGMMIRLAGLAGLAGLAFVVTAVIAWVLARSAGKKTMAVPGAVVPGAGMMPGDMMQNDVMPGAVPGGVAVPGAGMMVDPGMMPGGGMGVPGAGINMPSAGMPGVGMAGAPNVVPGVPGMGVTGAVQMAGMPMQKTEAELRAEIEERVRREMMEQEMRARMAAGMQGGAGVATGNGGAGLATGSGGTGPVAGNGGIGSVAGNGGAGPQTAQ